MCLTVTDKNIYKAEKDITCYKYLYLTGGTLDAFTSYHRHTRYTLGNLNKKTSFISKNVVFIGKRLRGGGYHSFVSKNTDVKDYILTGEPTVSEYSSKVAVKCIIPKGSKYIIGKQGSLKQYFSEKIIIKKILVAKPEKVKELV